MRKVVTMHSKATAGIRRWSAGALIGLVIAACSGAPAPRSAPAGAAGDSSAAAAAAQLEIESVELAPAATGTRIDLMTSGPLVWTTYRDGDDNLVVELPNSRPAASVADLMPDAGLVSEVRFEREESGVRPLTRLVVVTRAAAEHAAAAEGSLLTVELSPLDPNWAMAAGAEPAAELAEAMPEPTGAETGQDEATFEMAGSPAVVEEPLAEPMVGAGAETAMSGSEPPPLPATRLMAIEVESEGALVRVIGDGEFYHSSFTLENPDRFVVDLVGVVNAASQGSLAVGGLLVDRVRVAQFKSDPELVARVVVDLSRAAVPAISSGGGGLTLDFSASPATTLAEDLRVPEPAYADPEAEMGMGSDDGLPAADYPEAEEEWTDSYEEVAEAPYEEALEPETEEALAEAESAYEVAAYEEPAAEEPAYQEPAQEEPADQDEPIEEPVWEEPVVEEEPVYEEAVYEEPVYEEPVYEEPAWEPEPPMEAEAPAVRSGFEMFEVEPSGVTDPGAGPPGFASRRLDSAEKVYYGEPMTITLKDADVKDVLRSFAQISGLNIVVQPGVSGTVTVELTNVPWDQALEQVLKINSLGYQLEGNIMRIAPLSKLREEAEEQQRLRQAQALSIPLSTVMKRVSYADAAQLAGLLRSGGGASLMSQRGSVVVDNRTNTLIIKELPSFMDAIITVIETLDTPEPQVMIEARIVETTKRFSSTLGIAWGFQGIASPEFGNTTGLVFPNNIDAAGGVNLETGGQTGFLDISLGNVLNSFTLDAQLQAAESDGLINILSAPRITTLNNQQASIQSGLQIPIQTVANNTVSVQFVNATLRLDVTPHVTAEGTVLMDINIQKREPQLAFAVVGASNAPISTKDARTRVIVRDGGTTVIGGIYKVSTDRGEDRVPGLANVPILKHLFKNKRRSEENEELLIFITPRVVKL